MKICLKCDSEVKNEKDHKRICDGDVIYSDEFFYFAVAELIEKGYYVKVCKAGRKDNNSYILFDECVNKLPSLPKGYYLTKITDLNKLSETIKIIKNFSNDTRNIDIVKNAINVYMWSVKLPNSTKLI